MPSALAQAKSMRYELPAINFHLGETPPREPQGGGEHTECTARPSKPPLALISFFNQGAVGFAQRPEHVVAGHHVLDLLQIPLVRGLAGSADLDQVHVM